MNINLRKSTLPFLVAALAVPAWGTLSAQQQQAPADPSITVTGQAPTDLAGLTEGPEIEGTITARRGEQMQVTTDQGTATPIYVSPATKISSSGGFLGLNKTKLTADSLLNGLPVTIKTLQAEGAQPGGDLVASQISLRKGDLKTANMIRNGTNQRFDEQTAATEALRGRMGDIDKYNIKGTTNVHFDVGKADLSAEDKAQLCTAASQAQAQENALMLVVGYTDSTGGDELNQRLSEKRAARVINYLQQQCGWKPYRMLTPTGMAKADPLAPNDTPEGKAQNRRVAVNILVSKSVDGMTQGAGTIN